MIDGNPPWSVGQRNAAGNNPNASYPQMREQVAETYVQQIQDDVTQKKSLYDSYKMAIRWASDCVENKSIVAFLPMVFGLMVLLILG